MCKFASLAQYIKASGRKRVVIMYYANPIATRLPKAIVPVSHHPLVLFVTKQADSWYFARFFKRSIG
jgi:hypothetical protein